MRGGFAVITCAALFFGGCAQAQSDAAAPVRGGRLPPEADPPVVEPAKSDAAGSVREGCGSGPWAAFCPEARWARLVVKGAGHELKGDTGSALVAQAGGASYYVWAFRPKDASPQVRALWNESYRPLRRVEGIDVSSDGIRITWEVHGLSVWLDGGPTGNLRDINAQAIDELVKSSASVPYP